MTPRLSIVVVVYNMQREAPRTLFTLSPEYQQGVDADDYEVIVVDNGSKQPLAEEVITGFGSGFRALHIRDAQASPAAALNRGAALARGRYLGLMIDGARLLSPGMVRDALHCLEAHERPVVATLGFHLGPELQSISLRYGYNQEAEDQLLAEVEWRENGYRLFEISAFAGSCRYGALHSQSESFLLFLPRQLHDELGGADERFDLPGGGMVNLDLYYRACNLPQSSLIVLLGEASFHQFHNGAHTGLPLAEADRLSQLFNQQYSELQGAPFRNPDRAPILYGRVRPEVLPWILKSADLVCKRFGESRSQPPSEQSITDSTAAVVGPGSRVRDQDDVYPTQSGALAPALSFGLLNILGLRRQHRVLELGPLVTGKLLLSFLAPQHYHGIVPYSQQTGASVDAGLWQELIESDPPQGLAADEFNLELLGGGYDFVLADAVLCHAGHAQVGRCMTSARRALRPDGLLIGAVVEHHQDHAANSWVYPDLNYYSWATIARICASCGLHCRKIDWPHPLKTWFVATSNLRRLEAVAAAGVGFLPDELVLTDRKRRALDQASPSGAKRDRSHLRIAEEAAG